MKTYIHFLYIGLSILTCGNTKAPKNYSHKYTTNQDNRCCIPDTNMFLFKRVNKTLDPKDVSITNSLKSLNKEQIKTWLKPITDKMGYNIAIDPKYYKAVAFQKKTRAYTSIVLMITTNPLSEQFLVTVNDKGKYIDGLYVSYLKNISNSDVELDTLRNVYIFSTYTRSRFNNDTIRMYQVNDMSKNPAPHTDEEVWQEVYETIYLIQPDGKIAIIREKKKVNIEK